MSRAALVLICCSSLMGCIITRDPSYSSPANTPAVVTEHPDLPMTRFIEVDRSLAAAPDGGVGNPTEIVAKVRDPDIEDELFGVVFLDRNPNSESPTVLRDFRIPARGEEERADVREPIDFNEFPAGCHVLELHVSRQFVGILNPVAAEDDLGRGIWFVRVLENEEDDRALAGCGAGQ
ncbi:MAG: hypothetical protein H6719_23690 [Sandaracinaceae bacterium]|nr:hypothetical protein [Sandaracinaceae bacterium]